MSDNPKDHALEIAKKLLDDSKLHGYNIKKVEEIKSLAQAYIDKCAEVEALADLAIWMTGCGYDFTQHEYFVRQRDTLLKSPGGNDDPEPQPRRRTEMSYLLEVERNAEGNTLAYLAPISSNGEPESGYRIAGPKAWGGSNSLARLEISKDSLVTFIKEYAPEVLEELIGPQSIDEDG